jgi:excisionase family DNA binding protein
MDEMSVKLLTVQEVAELLNVHPNTVRQWSDQELIKSYRIGPRGDRRFRQEDITSFLNLKSKDNGNTVLIVDDDVSVCDMLQDVVKSKGYSVVVVNSGEKAIEVLDRQKFSLIFLDLVLPRLSGVEVLRHLKAIKSDAVVIIVSGYGESPIATEAMTLGPMFFVHKPFEVSAIRDILDLTVKLKSYGYRP